LNVIWNSISNETFEKCSILFKVKPLAPLPAPLPARRDYRPEGRAYAPGGEGENFSHPDR